MDKEEFQKKYDNSILVCCTEDKIKKVFNICDLMDLTVSNSKQATAILIGEQTAKSPLFHVEQFAFYLPRSTSRMFISLGEMPGIRLACAIVSGSIFVSFCLASVDKDWIEL